MHGQIKLGRWRPFTARQVLAPPDGYLWAATARLASLPVTGYDRLSSGAGEMRWRLLRLIPVLTAAWPRYHPQRLRAPGGGDRADPDRVPARGLG